MLLLAVVDNLAETLAVVEGILVAVVGTLVVVVGNLVVVVGRLLVGVVGFVLSLGR